METIYKYQLELTEFQQIVMPKRHRALSVQVQNGGLCIWVNVDNASAADGVMLVQIHGTGDNLDPLPPEYSFLGTVQMDSFVWHVYVTGG